MTGHNSGRRQLLKAAAVAAPLAAVAAVSTSAESIDTNALTIGVATNDFRTYSNDRLAQELADQGIETVQLFLTQTDSNYWKYNGRNELSDLSASRCKEISDAYLSRGVSIHSIGVYTNLIHPDPAERTANLAYFEAMMRVGAHMNVRTFITEAGHYHDPSGPVPRVEYHFQEDVWKMMIATGRQLAKLASEHDATILFEPFYRHFFATAKRTRLFLEELGSPRLRALLDPANLLEVNDLDEMFQQLGPYIDCLHAKDRKLHVDRGVPAGQGDLDYVKFVKLAAQHTPQVPLILEYVGPKDYEQALNHLKRAIQQAAGTR